MDSKLGRGLMVGACGAVVGLATGVAAFGDAVNGAVVFGPLGFLVGWLLPRNAASGNQTVAESSSKTPVDETESALGSQDFKNAESSIDEMVPLAGKLLLSIWNLQMRGLIAVGAMEHVVRRPWLLFALALVLLAVVFPIGIVFAVTGLAGFHYGASPRGKFIVLSQPS
jgi:hypothetical protein